MVPHYLERAALFVAALSYHLLLWKMKIVITEENIQTFGAGSLRGMLLAQEGDNFFQDPEVEIAFQLTTMSWRAQNGGPMLWVTPEFVLMEFLEDILELQAMGKTVRTSVVTASPA